MSLCYNLKFAEDYPCESTVTSQITSNNLSSRMENMSSELHELQYSINMSKSKSSRLFGDSW
uniref:Uncharacterized protein n=1 Tax=Rhizophora mucronata TaxID=61149 RepID=A0A2P2NBU9_RHIMU